MPKCIILRGIPCSGKSTFVVNNYKCYVYKFTNPVVLSCDTIRINFSGGKYIFSKNLEEKVWKTFYKALEFHSKTGHNNIIIDNTN